jgi:hypothetical protein
MARDRAKGKASDKASDKATGKAAGKAATRAGGAAPAKPSRRESFAYAYKITKQADPKIPWILAGVFVFAALVGTALFSLIPPAWLVMDILIGVLTGVLAVLIVFGRRAQKAQYAAMEGRPGAAAGALGMLKRGWKTDPAIAFTKQQDVVHRVVGPPGIVLVGEGNPGRLKGLLGSERVKHQRVAADTPIHEIVVGYGQGEVPLPKLVKHISKLGRKIKPAEMTDVLQRLKALDAQRSTIPIPKGPVPTSMKGYRGNLRGR